MPGPVFPMPDDESKEPVSSEDAAGKGSDAGLQAAAEDLMSCVASKDAAGVAEALKNAFAILDSSK